MEENTHKNDNLNKMDDENKPQTDPFTCESCGKNITSNNKETGETKKSNFDELIPEKSNNNKAIEQIIKNKFDRFSEWIHCMCVVTFDLELGQALEEVYPENAHLSEQEKINICYLAFPDSNSSCIGDTKYHVRLRSSPDNFEKNGINPIHKKFNFQCVSVQTADFFHYWGFVFFRQRKDKTIPRGYFQKSFIILTRLPFFNLYSDMVSLIASKYFENGKIILDIAYNEINNWPALKPGEAHILNVLGTVYKVFLPKADCKTHNNINNGEKTTPQGNLKQKCDNVRKNSMEKSRKSIDKDEQLTCNTCTENKNHLLVEKENENYKKELYFGPSLPQKVLNNVHEINIFKSLALFICNIYTLWELVLVSEPIVVIGSSPADCSQMVQSLISLIHPLCYFAEYRPYFTIHDTEFKEFTSTKTNISDVNQSKSSQSNEQKTSNSTDDNNSTTTLVPSIILGVTNPFFCKLLQNWPNLIRLPDQLQDLKKSKKFSFVKRDLNDDSNLNKSFDSSISSAYEAGKASEMNKNSNNSNIISSLVTGFNDSTNYPGLYSKYKPFLRKDKNLLIKKIQLGIKIRRPEQVQSALMRQHFLELTHSFMIPLERYMASLMPLQKDISPFKCAPNPNEFKQDEFLSTLEQLGPHLTSPLKGNWKGLYKKFFKSPNFKGWYEHRYKELKEALQHQQMQTLLQTDLNKWAQGKQEVEIIDMILKLRQKVNIINESSLASDISLKLLIKNQLMGQIETITQSLPEDSKQLIQKSLR